MRVESNGYWRFMLDQSRIDWADGILGETSIDVASVSDPVLIRGDGQVLYTLASICDDTDMGVSYVVRGSDHVTNTATQIQIIQALSGNVPKFAHHSLLVGSKGEGLSKRLGSLALGDMREAGLQPMALLSHLAKLGSSEPVELMGSLDEIILGFDLTKFGASPTKFDQMDLAPLTMKYLQGLSASDIIADILALGVPPEKAEDFWNIVRMNISTLKDLSAWWDLMEKGAEPKIDDQDREFVLKAVSLLPPGQFDANTWKTWTQNVTEVTGRSGKNLYMPLRQALTGMSHGPDMGHLLPFLKNIKIKNKP